MPGRMPRHRPISDPKEQETQPVIVQDDQKRLACRMQDVHAITSRALRTKEWVNSRNYASRWFPAQLLLQAAESGTFARD